MTVISSREQFDRNAAKYTVSAVHKHGASLPVLVAYAAPSADDVALDVATGSGHTALALAPHVKQISGVDVSPRMLDEARAQALQNSVTNIDFVEAAAEQLPFPDGHFTLVTSRHAPHHFHDISAFLREAYRVLTPGGRLVIADQISPDSGGSPWVDTWQRMRDPSHYRQRTVQEWRDLAAEAGFTWEKDQLVPYRLEFAWWTQQAGCTAAVCVALQQHAEAASPAIREAMGLSFDPAGQVIAHIEPMMVVRLVRRDANPPS